jgi:PKHD-type hydroxylase
MAEAVADFPLLTVFGGVFTDEECARIVDAGERLPPLAGRVNDPDAADGQHAVRDTTVRNLAPDDDFNWIYQRLLQQAGLHNQQALGFELESTETLQLLSYGPGQHYDWHVDIGTHELALRKLSLIALLSDPADYEGGELELFFGDRPTPVTKLRGSLVVFPSFVLHRVRAISRGRRRSLALWLRGSQRFR